MGEFTTKLHLWKPVVAQLVDLATDFNNNWDELESRLGNLYGLTEVEINQLKNLGTNVVTADIWAIVAGLTTHPIGGDGTAGRVERASFLTIANGTDAETLKCTLSSRWNGDAIAETDNIAKDATTGHYTLSADGFTLRIEASGLTGSALYVLPNVSFNSTGTIDIICYGYVTANDIIFTLRTSVTGTSNDITTLVDTGAIYMDIFYITDE